MEMQDIRYLAEGLNGIVAEATDLFEARIRELVEQGAPWELVREEARRMFISLVDGYRVQAEASGRNGTGICGSSLWGRPQGCLLLRCRWWSAGS